MSSVFVFLDDTDGNEFCLIDLSLVREATLDNVQECIHISWVDSEKSVSVALPNQKHRSHEFLRFVTAYQLERNRLQEDEAFFLSSVTGNKH